MSVNVPRMQVEYRPPGLPVLVTFAARHGDPYPRSASGEYIRDSHGDPSTWGPTLRAIGHPDSPLLGKITDVFYLCHSSMQGGTRRVGTSDKEVALETERAIARHLEPRNRPRFHIEQLPAKRPPNNHVELFELVGNALRRIRSLHPNQEIVLQLSSGTSAMHAVLLLAGSVGLIEGPIRMVQAERSEAGNGMLGKPVADVNLPVATILQLARSSTPYAKGGDEALSLSFDRAKSPALRKALTEAQRAAQLPFPVLLRGERGVGKSTIAQVIRAAGPYRKSTQDSCWPSVACGQFTDAERLNSELCGSVRGAYTGAENRWGLLKGADGDTLFLDEIQDLDARSQRVLIRVVEDGTYYRLGDDKPHRSKFRLICGTNQPDSVLLERLAADFYDRIRDIEIEIPPLRNCREDLPWMWEEAWGRVARQCGVHPGSLDAKTRGQVLKTLERHPLPGNWRDLRRLAVQIAAAATGRGADRDNSIGEVTERFCSIGSFHSVASSATNVPILASGHEQNRYRDLQAVLGPALSLFWEKSQVMSPTMALKELLGERNKASRAAKFIQTAFPERWHQVSAQRK